LKSGGTPAIESPGNAEAWLRTRPSAALAKLARDEVHLWPAELDAGTGRLAAFRHALDTITWDGLCA
jgi:hypothetical protein